MRSPNMASFLGLQRVDALHMPVPLSFVFVGLSGDGNMHANISAVDLQDWFAHLDHVLPHARVELSDIDCQSDGECKNTRRLYFRLQSTCLSVAFVLV